MRQTGIEQNTRMTNHFILLKSLFVDFSYRLASQSVVCREVASASPESLKEMQNLVLYLRLTEPGLQFYNTLR